MDNKVDKKRVRQRMKSQRANLSKERVASYSNRIWSKVYQMPVFQKATAVFIYSSIGNEVETREFVKVALEMGKKVAYPVTDMDTNTMTFHTVDTLSDLGRVKSGSFSLLEPRVDDQTKITPNELTLMIVPGLAFDQQFYRTGYGGGFYDRYLSKYPGLTTLGVCYDFQVVASLPVSEYDRPVRGLVTPGLDTASTTGTSTAHV